MSSESVAVPVLSRVGAPLFCNLIVSHRCFFKCQMCLNWKAPEADKALSFEECKKFVDGLSQFIDYKLDINIMGGEPLMLDWILPLCNYMYEKGFASIMSTNGYLIDETKAQEIADSRLEFLGLSLDGLKPHTHDTIRGMSGSHARIMSAIANLEARCKRPFSITFLTLILESNLGELPELVKWLSQPGGIHKEVSFTALLECGLVKDKEGWFRQAAYKHLWPQDPGKVSGVIDELIALKKQGHKIVNPVSQLEAFKEYYRDPEKFLRETEYCIHDYIIDLDPSSEILLSGHPLGSLKNSHDLKELWFSEKANQIRRYIDEYGCDSSRSCLINFLCAFPGDSDPYDHVATAAHFQAQRYGRLAHLYQQQGKHDLALFYFKKALEKNPGDAGFHMGVGHSYAQLNDYPAALAEYDQAMKLGSDASGEAGKHAGTLASQLAYVYQQQGKYDLALAHFKKALETNPADAGFHLGAAFNHLQLHEYEAALAEYDQAIRLESDVSQEARKQAEALTAQLGYSYQQQGKYDLALAHFKKALEKNPCDAGLHMGAAFNHLQLHEYQQALDAYRQAFRLNPDFRKDAEDDYVIALQHSSKPKMCNFALALGCMLRCKICHHWQCDERSIKRPGVAAWEQFFSSLRSEVADDFTIVFGGGEPLMYPAELLELISYAAGLGFRTALATSGHTINKKYAQQLVASGLTNIDLTILSLDRAVHDSLRGVRGSLARVLRAIDFLASSSDTLDIGINALITRPALSGLAALSEWVHRNPRLSGVHFQAITRPFHTPFVDSWHTMPQYRFLWPDDLEELEAAIDKLIVLKQQGCRISNPVPQFMMFKTFFKNPDAFVKPFTCNLVSGKFFAADADGTVKLCPYMQPLGNITDGDFRQLWHSGLAASAKAQVGRCKQNCHHLINCWYEEG